MVPTITPLIYMTIFDKDYKKFLYAQNKDKEPKKSKQKNPSKITF
jgi:hypothetical protein